MEKELDGVMPETVVKGLREAMEFLAADRERFTGSQQDKIEQAAALLTRLYSVTEEDVERVAIAMATEDPFIFDMIDRAEAHDIARAALTAFLRQTGEREG